MSSQTPPCARVRDALFDWAHHEPGVYPEVDAHLAECPRCRALADELRGMIADRRALAEAALPPELEASVFATLQPTIRTQIARARRPRWLEILTLALKPAAFAGAAAALIAVVGLWRQQADPSLGPATAPQRVATLTAVRGEVSILRRGGARVQAAARMTLAAGDSLATTLDARVALELEQERAVLLEGSEVALAALDERQITWRLERGRLINQVRPGFPGVYRVEIPQAEVLVTGTVFDVGTAEDMAVISTYRGTVQVTPRRSTERHPVVAGRRLIIKGDQILEQALLGGELEMSLQWLDPTRWDEPAPALSMRTPPLSSDALAPLAPPAPASVKRSDTAAGKAPGDGVAQGRPRPQDEQKPPSERRRSHRGGKREVEPDDEPMSLARSGGTGEAVAEASEQLVALADAGKCQSAEGVARRLDTASDAERGRAAVRIANCYYGQGDLTGALRLYRQAARQFPSTAAGENASYEIGRLLRQQGDTKQARKAFERYLERHPSGALAGEAKFWTCSLSAELGERDGALRCLRQYRLRYKSSRRVNESYLIEATLLREKGDCPGAIKAYDAYLKNPGQLADQARRWREWCQSR